MIRSFDRLAAPYHALERLAFGNRLQRLRVAFLPRLAAQRRALLIGDGDGRFSATLLEAAPGIRIDSVDQSLAMLRRAQARSRRHADRFHPIHADARAHRFPRATYDLLVLHFCLDCFRQTEVDALLPQLESALLPGGLLVHSDFQCRRPWHRFTVAALYLAFRAATAMPARRLPDAKWSDDVPLRERREGLRELIFTELRQKRP